MTGRLPYHVFETSDYVDGGFNMLPAKLRQVGYVSHSPSVDLCSSHSRPSLLWLTQPPAAGAAENASSGQVAPGPAAALDDTGRPGL